MKQFIYRLVISLSVLLFGMTGMLLTFWCAMEQAVNRNYDSSVNPLVFLFDTFRFQNLLPYLLFFLVFIIIGFLLLVFYAAPVRGPRKPPLSPAERLYRFLDEINHASGPGDPPEP